MHFNDKSPVQYNQVQCKNPIIFLISTSPIGSAAMSRDFTLVNDSLVYLVPVLITHLT